MNRRFALVLSFAALLGWAALQHDAYSQQPTRAAGGAASREAALAEPFKGITANGAVEPGLFKIRSTGVSTEEVLKAANAFLSGLTEEQRNATLFPIDDKEWRHWINIHRAERHGVTFRDMTEQQRELATGVLRAGLSAKGLKLSQDIMRLNYTIAEMVNNFQEYGDLLYNLTVMGKPSATEPWGWQLEGHHLIINYFVLGDQVVMTPTFMGSEPIQATSGKYAGIEILRAETEKALAVAQSLNESQRAKGILQSDKTRNSNLAEAYKDNLILDYAGIPGSELDGAQKQKLLDLIGEYVGNMDDGHAKVKMEEVRKHIDRTHFAWIGQTSSDAVFYYRVHSPVILIEFDHQTPIAMRELPRVPTRQHIHSVVRTPNGNDYGKDLLRQHYERSHRSD
jgi:hypothetical protein